MLWVPNASLISSLCAVFWVCPELVTEFPFPGHLFAKSEYAKHALLPACSPPPKVVAATNILHVGAQSYSREQIPLSQRDLALLIPKAAQWPDFYLPNSVGSQRTVREEAAHGERQAAGGNKPPEQFGGTE